MVNCLGRGWDELQCTATVSLGIETFYLGEVDWLWLRERWVYVLQNDSVMFCVE